MVLSNKFEEVDEALTEDGAPGYVLNITHGFFYVMENKQQTTEMNR
jgi:hypothetical protein